MTAKRGSVTLIDVARATGVSKSTVSLALQGSSRVHPDTADAVRQATQRNALANALQLDPPPTAALCFNDIMALGALLHLRRAGIAAGRDFAVVGFDDLPEAALYTPALTTVRLDPQDLGEQAARLMLHMIEADEIARADVQTGVELIVRESCGGGPAPEFSNQRHSS